MKKLKQLLREIKQSTEQYIPWAGEEYTELYKRAELRISKERAYTLMQIMQLGIEQDGSVIEMGVYKGCTAYMICWLLQQRNVNKKVFLCDTFQGTPRMRNEEKGDANRGGEYADTSLEYVKNKLKVFSGRCVFVPGLIPDSLKIISLDEKYCFAHIHLNLYQSTMDALEYLRPRICKRGIILIEDYGVKGCVGVRTATDEFCAKYELQSLYLGTGQLMIFA